MRFLTGLLFVSTSLVVQAEYRAFQLEIVNRNQQVLRTVASTLDDIQYPRFHPLNQGEYIRIADTWMCWERSDHFTPICRSPRAPAIEDEAED